MMCRIIVNGRYAEAAELFLTAKIEVMALLVSISKHRLCASYQRED